MDLSSKKDGWGEEKVSQYEIIEVLKNRKREWFTTKDIAEMTGFSRFAVTGLCRRMRKYDMISYQLPPKKSSNREYKYKYKPDQWRWGFGR